MDQREVLVQVLLEEAKALQQMMFDLRFVPVQIAYYYE
jgi:hypothetical protein